MRKYIFLVIALVFILPSITGCSVAYRDVNLTVEPLQTYNLTADMKLGDVIEGYFSVKGGNNDIHFYLEDSYGNKILNIDRVQGRYDFSHKATSEGFHSLFFDNSFSLVTSKLVFLHYRIR